jgi:thiol:disulfide interchange protein DsbC
LQLELFALLYSLKKIKGVDMKKLLAVVVAVIVLGLAFQVYAAPLAASPEAALAKAFPQIKVDSISESPIKGLYEVVSGQNIFFFYPEKDLLLVGDMYAPPGQNLTGEKKRELKAKFMEKVLDKIKDLPLDKAVKIGSGPKKVIEFTDPDCPFCRRASDALKKRTDVTRYVFFTPLAHPNAITKVYYILNSKDKEKAYHDMMEGKPLPNPTAEPGKEIKALAEEHMQLGRSMAVDGTPTFFINGQQVVGADMERIDSLLK